MANFNEFKNILLKELNKINESLMNIKSSSSINKFIFLIELFQILFFIIEPTILNNIFPNKNYAEVSYIFL